MLYWYWYSQLSLSLNHQYVIQTELTAQNTAVAQVVPTSFYQTFISGFLLLLFHLIEVSLNISKLILSHSVKLKSIFRISRNSFPSLYSFRPGSDSHSSSSQTNSEHRKIRQSSFSQDRVLSLSWLKELFIYLMIYVNPQICFRREFFPNAKFSHRIWRFQENIRPFYRYYCWCIEVRGF